MQSGKESKKEGSEAIRMKGREDMRIRLVEGGRLSFQSGKALVFAICPVPREPGQETKLEPMRDGRIITTSSTTQVCCYIQLSYGWSGVICCFAVVRSGPS